MSKHTEGPWRVGDNGATVFGPKRADNVLETIAIVSRQPLANQTTKANARLIALAPDMRAALLFAFRSCVQPECVSTTGVCSVCDHIQKLLVRLDP